MNYLDIISEDLLIIVINKLEYNDYYNTLYLVNMNNPNEFHRKLTLFKYPILYNKINTVLNTDISKCQRILNKDNYIWVIIYQESIKCDDGLLELYVQKFSNNMIYRFIPHDLICDIFKFYHLMIEYPHLYKNLFF